MHQLILIAAMSTTTGLFGGKHCGGKARHARPVAPACYSAAPCGATSPYAGPSMAPVAYPAPPQTAPTADPNIPVAPPVPPAPPAPSPVPTPSAAIVPATSSVANRLA